MNIHKAIPVSSISYEIAYVDPSLTRMKSWLWSGGPSAHMRKVDGDIHDELKGRALCNHCEMLIYYNSSTSTLSDHIFRNHRAIYDARTRAVAEADSPRPMDSHVIYGGEFMKRYLKWVTATYKPYDVCNEPQFRHMVEGLNSKIQPIDRNHVTRKAGELAVRVKLQISSSLVSRSIHWHRT